MSLPAILASITVSLVGSVLPADHPVSVRAEAAAQDVIEAVNELMIPDEERETWARLAFTWSFWEASWKPDAIGDSGRSVGIMQVNRLWLGPVSAEEVLSSRLVGYRVGINVMRQAVEKCGSLRGGLGLFASGRCYGARELVKRRCRTAGVSC